MLLLVGDRFLNSSCKRIRSKNAQHVAFVFVAPNRDEHTLLELVMDVNRHMSGFTRKRQETVPTAAASAWLERLRIIERLQNTRDGVFVYDFAWLLHKIDLAWGISKVWRNCHAIDFIELRGKQ